MCTLVWPKSCLDVEALETSAQLRMQSTMETTTLPDSPARLRALLRAVLRLISQEREKWHSKLRALGCRPPARTPVERESAGDCKEKNSAVLREAIQEAVTHWDQEKSTLEAVMRSSCVAETAGSRAKHTKPFKLRSPPPYTMNLADHEAFHERRLARCQRSQAAASALEEGCGVRRRH